MRSLIRSFIKYIFKHPIINNQIVYFEGIIDSAFTAQQGKKKKRDREKERETEMEITFHYSGVPL